MTPEMENLLGVAYELDQLHNDRMAAVAYLRNHVSEGDGLAREAAAERAHLAAVVRAREQGGQHGDHVSAVLHDLLTLAIGE